MVLPAELYAIIPNLEVGKTYEFRVLAVNQAGRGEPSDASVAVCIKATRGINSILLYCFLLADCFNFSSHAVVETRHCIYFFTLTRELINSCVKTSNLPKKTFAKFGNWSSSILFVARRWKKPTYVFDIIELITQCLTRQCKIRRGESACKQTNVSHSAHRGAG